LPGIGGDDFEAVTIIGDISGSVVHLRRGGGLSQFTFGGRDPGHAWLFERCRLDTVDAVALAGINDSESAVTFVLVNPSPVETTYITEVRNLPWPQDTYFDWSLSVLNDATYVATGGFGEPIVGSVRGDGLALMPALGGYSMMILTIEARISP